MNTYTQSFGYNHSAWQFRCAFSKRPLSRGQKLFQRYKQHASLTDVINCCLSLMRSPYAIAEQKMPQCLSLNFMVQESPMFSLRKFIVFANPKLEDTSVTHCNLSSKLSSTCTILVFSSAVFSSIFWFCHFGSRQGIKG